MDRMAFSKRVRITTLALAAWLTIFPAAEAVPPAWWSARGVTQAGAVNDFATANVGQLKNLVRGAKDELDARLPGGAGAPLHSLVQSWITPPAPPAPQPDNYATLTQGQLKETVKLVYDRLLAAGHLPSYLAGNPYPWTGSTGDDDNHVLVPLGQLKHVLDFDLANPDRDRDGLADLLELAAFGTSPGLLDSNANGLADGLEDGDGDRIPNLDELAFGLNPVVNDATLTTQRDAFTYDRLGRMTSEQRQTGARRNVLLDREGNINAIN